MLKENLKIRYLKNLYNNTNDLIINPLITHGLKRSLRMLLKELVIFFNHKSGLNYWKSKKKNYEKIQIGGGKHILNGFLNIDIFPPADLIYDVRENIPIDSNSTKFIFSEHFLEHIDYPTSVIKFINECYRILKKDGKIVIGVPDSASLLKAYVRGDKKYYNTMIRKWYANRNCLKYFNTYIDLVNYHFRDQDDDDKYTPHLWAYDFDKLKSLLLMVGFKSFKKWKFDPKIASSKRYFGSIYIIARK